MTTPATWDPDNKHADLTLSNGNRTFSGTGGWKTAIANMGKSSGKWYWEITSSTYRQAIGVVPATFSTSQYPGQVSGSWGCYIYVYNNGQVRNEGTLVNLYLQDIDSPAVVGVALDLDNGKIWYRENAGWGFISGVRGNPAAGTNPAGTFTVSNDLYPAVAGGNVSGYNVTINAGQESFTYSVPTGFSSGFFGETGTVVREDARLDLRASATEFMDMATFLAMCADVRIDLPLDLTAGLIATQSLQAPLHAVGWARKFLKALLMATDGTIMRDLAARLQATDGTTLADLAVSCRAIRQVPGYRAIIAQRLRSVKHGL